MAGWMGVRFVDGWVDGMDRNGGESGVDICG